MYWLQGFKQSTVCNVVLYCLRHFGTYMAPKYKNRCQRMSRHIRNLASARVVGAIKPPATGQADYFDATVKGFGIRVSAGGRMTWFVMYRDSDSRRQRFTLGTYPALSCKDARREALSTFEAIAKGGNPAKEKKARKMADTFAEMAEAYLRHYAKGEAYATWEEGKALSVEHPRLTLQGRELVFPPDCSEATAAKLTEARRAIVAYLKAPDDPPAPNKRSWKVDQRIIELDMLPEWKHKKAETFTRADVNRLLDKIVERGASIQANRTLEIVRKMFSWAIGESRVTLDANPCSEIKKRGIETPRDRHLTADEINALWPMQGNADRPAKINDASRLALLLMLVTGQRPGEVLGMPWGELDPNWQTGEKPTWTIPSERSKNGRAHSVPLSSLAVEVLIEAKVLAGDSPFVFPSPRGNGPMLVSSLSHALIRSQHFGLATFRPHDLRRTVATHLEGPECGISRFVVARILNHADMSITGRHYSQYQHLDEKRQGLNAWARLLADIIKGEKSTATVITLQRT
jgi:integrase